MVKRHEEHEWSSERGDEVLERSYQRRGKDLCQCGLDAGTHREGSKKYMLRKKVEKDSKEVQEHRKGCWRIRKRYRNIEMGHGGKERGTGV